MGYYNWNGLFQTCQSCQKCALADSRAQVVLGAGVPTAEILLVGEAPGAQEDAQGEAFVGPSGRLLDEMLALIDLSRYQNVYITNLVKCHPPQNRPPLNTEQEACLPYLRNQFLLIRPKIVVCLGRTAAKRLIRPDYKISTEHGTFVEKNGVYFTATYHPSALLHEPSRRPTSYQDLKLLQQKIHAVCPSVYSPPLEIT